MNAVALLNALGLLHAAGIVDAASWYSLHADRDAELQKCATEFGGSVTFLSASAETWWTSNTTGDQVCAGLNAGSCTKVMDWQCNVVSCTETSEASRATECSGAAGPTPAPTPPAPTPIPEFPTSHGCRAGGAGAGLPYCNTTLPISTRVADLVSKMTLPEKCLMTGDGATVGGGGIPRLGIEQYSWNTEALHGLAAACLEVGGVTRCPTVFPVGPGMGATFNLSLANKMGVAISDETRAMNNFGGCRNRGSGGCGWDNGNWYIGLNVWVPNVNINRDPRWGRNIEVPSEDPFHAGAYATAVVHGVQWGGEANSSSIGAGTAAATRYTKINAALKHFFAYSVEDGRGSTDFTISAHDITDTYLPSFEAPIVQADAKGYMCSYSSVNGLPSCGSAFLARTARRDWNMSGYVVSDCGGVNDINGYLGVNASEGAAIALRDGGVDINCGGGLTNHICDAIGSSLVDESVLDASLERSLTLLFEAGMFDPLDGGAQPYTELGFEKIGSDATRALAHEAALQALVLLKNDRATLPLDKAAAPTAKLALLGPHAKTQLELGGNYFESICPVGGTCVPSLAQALASAPGAAPPTVVEGCQDTNCVVGSEGHFSAAVAAAKGADVVVLALGLVGSPKIESARATGVDKASNGHNDGTEGEGHDRTYTGLPDGQMQLVQQVLTATTAKKVVVVLFNGGGLAIEALMNDARIGAVVEAFYPGVAGATPLVETLYGRANRWSKLPYTLLGTTFTAEQAMKDMNMTDGLGRTYKYYKGNATIRPFGFGLSYTSFALSSSTLMHGSSDTDKVMAAPHATARMATTEVEALEHGPRPARTLRGASHLLARASVAVTNTGTMAGDEVCFLFHNASAAAYASAAPNDPLALKQLIAFERVRLSPGETRIVVFDIDVRMLSTVNALGQRETLNGVHELIFSRGHGKELRQHIEIVLPAPKTSIVLSAPTSL